MKLFPDMIPLVGLVTWSERGRREEGLSVRDTYLPIFHWKTVVFLGTQNWPKVEDWQAQARAVGLATRNVGFAAWHSFSPMAIALGIQKAASLITS